MSENDKGLTNNDAPEVLRLSPADAMAFAQALVSPPEPSSRLVEAARRYLKWKRS